MTQKKNSTRSLEMVEPLPCLNGVKLDIFLYLFSLVICFVDFVGR